MQCGESKAALCSSYTAVQALFEGNRLPVHSLSEVGNRQAYNRKHNRCTSKSSTTCLCGSKLGSPAMTNQTQGSAGHVRTQVESDGCCDYRPSR